MCVSSFEKFNEKFRNVASNSVYCKCFDLMHALSQHFSSPACHISNPKSKNKLLRVKVDKMALLKGMIRPKLEC